jgi:membrane-associated HD superfamily phosphohydrolase
LETVGEEDYRYPGPKPHSRETAILMLSDGIEASVRALDDPTPQRIRDQIREIIDQKISDGQFDNVDLTLQDIHRIGESFFNTLTGVYHNRIKYPGAEGESSSDDKKGS